MFDSTIQDVIQEVATYQEKIPLNKDYNLNLDVDYSKMINQSNDNLFTQLFYIIYKEIEKAYNFKEMTNIFFSMKLLKKFVFPENFQKDYNEDIMDKSGKEFLSHFQEHSHKYYKRDRANTYQDNYYNRSRSNFVF